MIDWRHWHNEPYLVGGLVLLGWVWAIFAGPLRERLLRRASLAWNAEHGGSSRGAGRFPKRQAWCFYSSLLVFYLAVGSPLDQVGERFLFSAHMLQHQLLIYPAAVLFLLGVPSWVVDGALAKLGLVKPTDRGRAALLPRFLAHPGTCLVVYTLVISLWHMPYMYDWALRNKVVHVAEHVMFFGAALFYWWPMLSPSKALPPISYAAQMIYFVAVLIAMTPVFAYITFSSDVLYPTYEYAPRLFADFTAAADQLLAGVAMKIVGMSVALAAIGVSFYRWSHENQDRSSPRPARATTPSPSA